MTAIEAIVFAGTAGFAVVVVATILVIVGIGQEERRGTLTDERPPTVPALLARRVLGTYFCLLPEEHDEHDDPRGMPQ
jgi:hypothetical protein